jgi:hypothetical protein
MQGAGASGMVGVGMGEQQAAYGVSWDARVIDLPQDRLDIDSRARIDDDRVVAIVDQIDVAVERVGEIEPHQPAPDQLDVFRQLHDCVSPLAHIPDENGCQWPPIMEQALEVTA